MKTLSCWRINKGMETAQCQIPEKLVPQALSHWIMKAAKGLNAATASFNVKPKAGPFVDLEEKFQVLRTCCQLLNLFRQESRQCCQSQAEVAA